MTSSAPIVIAPNSTGEYEITVHLTGIDQVPPLGHVKSSSFQCCHSKSLWHLAFYPLGRSEVQGMASFLLNHQGTTHEKVEFSLRIKSHLPNGNVIQHRQLSYDFHNNGYGYLDMLTINDLNDPAKGFLVNNTVLAECYIRFPKPSVSFTLDLQNALLSSDFSDAVVRCGSESFPVHKLVLSLRSPVFSAMFHSKMMESTKGELVISDFSPAVVKQFLVCLYSNDDCNLQQYNTEELLELCKLSSKYGVKSLQQLIEKELSSQLSVDNVIDLLMFADAYQCSELKSRVFGFLQLNMKSVLDKHKPALTDLMGELSVQFMSFLIESSSHSGSNNRASDEPR